jgi:hypothetical protein
VGGVLLTLPLTNVNGQVNLIGPALLLVSDESGHISGQTLVFNGGMICL